LEQAGRQFRTQSDTEVLLEACAYWGPAAAIPRLNGIFAFSLWDRSTRTLVLARDHLGVKPLYWAHAGEAFLFGSELRALRRMGGFRPEIDRNALASFFRFSYVPAPATIYRGVRKLEPGAMLFYRPGHKPRIERYFDLCALARRAVAKPRAISDAEAVDGLEALLRDAVSRQLVADVPVGLFLSGGIDSSTVAALAQSASPRPVRTFSIGFEDPAYDEAPHARAVAEHLGTDHAEFYVAPRHALDLVPRIADWFDEPFADSSQLPTYLVSEMTRQHVTVALSGDGGDELFAGYPRYAWSADIWRWIGRLPPKLRHGLGDVLGRIRPGTVNRLFAALPAAIRFPRTGERLQKLALVMGTDGQQALYRNMLSHWTAPQEIVGVDNERRGILWDAKLAGEIPDFVERMQLIDALTYLPDDILTKVDRTSMAVSLEARVPLLDPRVVAYAWGLPPEAKMRAKTGKWALRQVLYRHVPRELVERPKMGFGAPIAAWLKGSLRDWAEHLLSERSLAADGLLAAAPIRAVWKEHLSGTSDRAHLLWDVLMFQAWKERWLNGANT
jgi:asparagine synthase (glutamine-hydrolysing)